MSDVVFFFANSPLSLKIPGLRPQNEGLLLLNHHLCDGWKTFIFVNRRQTNLFLHQRKMCRTDLRLLMVSLCNVCVCFPCCACRVGWNQTSIPFMKTFPVFCSVGYCENRCIPPHYRLYCVLQKNRAFTFDVLTYYWNNQSQNTCKTLRVIAPPNFFKWNFMFIYLQVKVCSHGSLLPTQHGQCSTCPSAVTLHLILVAEARAWESWCSSFCATQIGWEMSSQG